MYTRFVNELLECVFKLISKYDNKLSAFAEHGADSNCMQEVAFLRDDDAVLFVDIIHDNSDILGVDKDDYELILPKSKFSRIKYSHSCYPKNVRRWMKGTLSRKKRCRAEFITLVVCWAIDWKRKMGMEDAYVECRNGLLEACRKVFSDSGVGCERNDGKKLSDNVMSGEYKVNTVKELVEILWMASQIAYVEACKERVVVKDRREGIFEAVRKDVEKDIGMDLGI